MPRWWTKVRRKGRRSIYHRNGRRQAMWDGATVVTFQREHFYSCHTCVHVSERLCAWSREQADRRGALQIRLHIYASLDTPTHDYLHGTHSAHPRRKPGRRGGSPLTGFSSPRPAADAKPAASGRPLHHHSPFCCVVWLNNFAILFG